MELTAAQKTSLKNDIIAASDQACVDLEADPTNSDKAFAVAALYNLPAGTDFWGNHRSVPLADIRGSITFKNYTPSDLPPNSAASNAGIVESLRYLNRIVMAQTLQLNLNNLFLGLSSFDATNATLVAALKDATNTDMETGAAGATRKGGWSNVQTIICRKATRVEQLLANTAGGNGAANTTAATFTFEGNLSTTQVLDAMANG